MTITIPDELEEFVQAKLQAGGFENPAAVVTAALSAWQGQELYRTMDHEKVEQLLLEAIDSPRIPWDEANFDRIIESLRGKAPALVSLRVVQTPESLADIALQADYYATRESIALAQRYTEAVKTSVRLLAAHPWIGKETNYAHPKLAGIRFFLVRKPFDKHLIFYRICGDTLDIVRVIDGRRDLPRRLFDPPGTE